MAVRWRARLLIQTDPTSKLTDNIVPDAIYSSAKRESAINGILPYALTMSDDDTVKIKIIVEKVEYDDGQTENKRP